MEAPKKKKSPTVGEFMQNIYSEQYFSESVARKYFDAFYEGYNMQEYAFSENCQESFTELMDQLYEFNLNMTRRKSAVDPYYLTMKVIGDEMNDSWYYCYQFGDAVYDDYATNAENFVDFGDVYLSWIFNMLTNSLNIKISTENMIEANEEHDTEAWVKNLAAILRACLYFESYQSVDASIYTLATKPSDFLESVKNITPRK